MDANASAPPPDLSALVVNYNSADYCIQCVDSLLAQAFEVDGRPGRIEVIVLDNDSRPDDQERLRAVETKPGVTLVYTGENLGYGPANNRGAAMAKGRWIYVLNPDVKVLPGAIATMLDVLRAHPNCAAVGPGTWMDDDCTLLHPPNDVPRVRLRTLMAFAHLSPWLGRVSARRRTKRALHHWRAKEPVAVEMLSGASFITPREVIERIGLFDENFPLYYEDTDWFARVRQAGMTMIHVPKAEIIHYFSRSALQDYAAAMEKAGRAEAHYYRKYFGPRGVRWVEKLNGWVKRAIDRRPEGMTLGDSVDLGRATEPPTFRVEAGGRQLLGEIAGNPMFSLAAGTFVDDGVWRLSDGMWNQLWDGRYYSRLMDPDSFVTLGSWTFEKSSQPSDQPVTDAL